MPELLPAVPVPPCPRPGRCPVATTEFEALLSGDPADLVVCEVDEGEPWVRVYESIDGMAAQNPGYGRGSRFAPFPGTGVAPDYLVPTMYLARSLDAALMETVLRSVDGASTSAALPPVVTGHDLLGHQHAKMLLPRPMRLLDLRDPALEDLGIPRSGVVSSAALHYPCTRRIAELVHAHAERFDGILWHSRQAELAWVRAAGGLVITGRSIGASVGRVAGDEDEVMVLFGTRVAEGRTGRWTLAETPDSNGALFEGEGRAAVLRVAAQVGAVVDWDISGR
jgi:hypothetical protein